VPRCTRLQLALSIIGAIIDMLIQASQGICVLLDTCSGASSDGGACWTEWGNEQRPFKQRRTQESQHLVRMTATCSDPHLAAAVVVD
jgi:hypothetical protein